MTSGYIKGLSKQKGKSGYLVYGICTLTILTVIGYTFVLKPRSQRSKMREAEQFANILLEKEKKQNT